MEGEGHHQTQPPTGRKHQTDPPNPPTHLGRQTARQNWARA
jgi:hypothetical protein